MGFPLDQIKILLQLHLAPTTTQGLSRAMMTAGVHGMVGEFLHFWKMHYHDSSSFQFQFQSQFFYGWEPKDKYICPLNQNYKVCIVGIRDSVHKARRGNFNAKGTLRIDSASGPFSFASFVFSIRVLPFGNTRRSNQRAIEPSKSIRYNHNKNLNPHSPADCVQNGNLRRKKCTPHSRTSR